MPASDTLKREWSFRNGRFKLGIFHYFSRMMKAEKATQHPREALRCKLQGFIVVLINGNTNIMSQSKENRGVISASDNQITLFYNPKSLRGKQTLAYAKTHGLPLEKIDILKTPLTGTQITELAKRLGLPIEKLVNQEHYKYRRKFTSQCFTPEDWITVVQNHPEIMIQPIALRGNNTVWVKTPTDIIRI